MDNIDEYEPLVSVIIPTLPHRKISIDTAVSSIKSQTYKKFEIIIQYEGKPAGRARNLALFKKAKGDFIAFLDDDDTWEPTKIEKQLKVMFENPDCPLVTCYSHDKRFGQDKINKPPEVSTQKQILNAFNYSSTSTYLFRAYPLKLMKGFDESLPSAQEYELAIRISDKHNLRCVPEVLVEQHSGEQQISENWTKKVKGIKAVFKKHKKLFLQASRLNLIKYYGLLVIFNLGHIFGNRIYKIISPMKSRHEKSKDVTIARGTIQHFDYKLATAFKEKGFTVNSISIYKPEEKYMEPFTRSFYLLSSTMKAKQISKKGRLLTILRIINRIPRLGKAKKYVKGSTFIGVSEPNTFITYLFFLFRKSTKIYLPYDITYFRYNDYTKTPYLERFCEKKNFRWCDAIMHKVPEQSLQDLPRSFTVAKKPSIQFLPYCSKLLPIKNNTSKQINIVYVGGVYPSYSFPYLNSTAKVFEAIAEYGAKIDVYPLNYDQVINRFDYRKLGEHKNCVIHKPVFGDDLLQELQKYDYGLYSFKLDSSIHGKLLETAFGNKVATYLEAGLPIIVTENLSFVSDIIEKNNLGFSVKNLFYVTQLKRCDKKFLDDFDKARKEFTFDKHFPRLLDFIREVESK